MFRNTCIFCYFLVFSTNCDFVLFFIDILLNVAYKFITIYFAQGDIKICSNMFAISNAPAYKIVIFIYEIKYNLGPNMINRHKITTNVYHSCRLIAGWAQFLFQSYFL